MTMVDDNELARLRTLRVPVPNPQAKIGALHAAMTAFDEAQEENSPVPQGSAEPQRLTSRAAKLWREIMQKKLVATPAIAGLIALPIAGYTALYLLDQQNFNFGGDRTIAETSADKPEANAPVSTSKPAKTEPAGKMEVEQSPDLDETLVARRPEGSA